MTDNATPHDAPSQATHQAMIPPINQLISDEVELFFATQHQEALSAHDVEFHLLNRINNRLISENTQYGLKGSRAYQTLRTLTPAVIAGCMLKRNRIVRIMLSEKNTDPNYDVLAVYMDHGPNTGIYVTDEVSIRVLAREYNFSISPKELDHVIDMLADNAPRVMVSANRDLIAVNNGIFDYKTKTLLPFTPEIVFTAKSAVNYNENAVNPVIHNDADGTDWDIESWMADLNDDPEIVALLWEILSAIIRPNVAWDKTAWFLSEVGNNGKGTLLTLMRNLCGERAWTSIPVADFGKDFHLEPLIRTNAVLVDENDVGEYVDRAANLKAVITNDVILINRKNKTPIAYQFRGFMVQCVNDTPRFRDKSGSLYRRQLIIPFDKSFTGAERKYIKQDYMHRTEVLEYVLYRVLSGNFYELSEPAAVRAALHQYKIENDPVRAFAEEFLDRVVWDLLPWRFLYALYRAWLTKDQPSNPPLGYNKFVKHLTLILQEATSEGDGYGWFVTPAAVRTKNRILGEEPLAVEYNLDQWFDIQPVNGSIRKVGTPHNMPVSTRGLLRASACSDDLLNEIDEDDESSHAMLSA
jgi:putative DNA primase/helicase